MKSEKLTLESSFSLCCFNSWRSLSTFSNLARSASSSSCNNNKFVKSDLKVVKGQPTSKSWPQVQSKSTCYLNSADCKNSVNFKQHFFQKYYLVSIEQSKHFFCLLYILLFYIMGISKGDPYQEMKSQILGGIHSFLIFLFGPPYEMKKIKVV